MLVQAKKAFSPAAMIIVKVSNNLGTSERAIDAGRPIYKFIQLAVTNVMHRIMFTETKATKYILTHEKGTIYIHTI